MTTSDTIIKKLYSNNPQKSIEAIDEIAANGNCSYLPMLIDTLLNNENIEIKHKITTLLSEIKHKDAVNELIKAIENPKYLPIQETLTRVCWENGLDYSPHLSTFVKLLINGEYMTAFEAFTVIENTEEKITEASMNEYLQQLRSALDNASDDRKTLLHGIIQFLPSLI